MPFDGQKIPDNARVLLDAADLIRQHGLAKHVEHSADGFCIGGAILYIEHGRRDYDDEGKSVYSCERWRHSPGIKCAYKHLKMGGLSEMICWNNKDERTEEEVIVALEGAAFSVMAKV